MRWKITGRPGKFFENRWRPILDYIEYTIAELQTSLAEDTNPRVASMMFQGMLREALYAKCITRSDRYQMFELNELVDHLIDLFFKALGYVADTDA